MKNKLTDHPNYRFDKPLFTYVLSHYWDELSKNWCENTQDGYIFYYNKITPYFLDRPLEELDQEDVDMIMGKIQAKKVEESGKEYKKSTLQKIMYLIRIVVHCAAEHKVISNDFLWGTAYSLGNSEREKENEKELVTLKKSLSIDEEIKIGRRLFENPMQPGQNMGLALMFALGIRNGEACGLTFRAIREMESYPGNYVLRIYQTTIGESNELKEGGKTANAPRKLPLPSKIYDLLKRRKDLIEAKIASGEIKLPETMESIDDLPIACKGSEYTVFCSSRELRKAGKALFEEVKVDEDEMAYIDREMSNKNVLAEMGLQEKDPTVYLFRRNLGTHLRILGLDQSEIEAFMGHSILDSRAERNDFENEDMIFAIKEKLEQRPIIGTLPSKIYKLSGKQTEIINSIGDQAQIELKLEEGERARLDISAIEPKNALHIEITDTTLGEDMATVKGIFYHGKAASQSPINVTGDYQTGYAVENARIEAKGKEQKAEIEEECR